MYPYIISESVRLEATGQKWVQHARLNIASPMCWFTTEKLGPHIVKFTSVASKTSDAVCAEVFKIVGFTNKEFYCFELGRKQGMAAAKQCMVYFDPEQNAPFFVDRTGASTWAPQLEPHKRLMQAWNNRS